MALYVAPACNKIASASSGFRRNNASSAIRPSSVGIFRIACTNCTFSTSSTAAYAISAVFRSLFATAIAARHAHIESSLTKRHRRIAASHWPDRTWRYNTGTCALTEHDILAPSIRRTVQRAPSKDTIFADLPRSPSRINFVLGAKSASTYTALG